MPNENEKAEDSVQNPSEKINYAIRTMDADLKNEGFANSSFDLSNTESTPKEEKSPKEIIKIDEEPVKQGNPNPFLKDLAPIAKNISPEFPKKNPETEENKVESLKKVPQKPISPILEKNSEEHIFLNNKLIIVLFFISLTAVCAGLYYFYSIKKSDSTLTETEEVIPPEMIAPEAPVSEEKNIPEKLKNSEILSIQTETSLVSSLLEKKVSLPENVGNYYEIRKDGAILSPTDLLTLLGISFPEEVLSKLDSSWISLYPQENILKMNLILKIEENSTELASFLESNEYRLPELLKPLFIDEAFILQDNPIIFQESGIVENIRFYNFSTDSTNKSIDWGVINNKYLILSTSKESALKLMEDLKTEQFLSEDLKEIELEAPQI